jgi:SAM-dependent methyltransferase
MADIPRRGLAGWLAGVFDYNAHNRDRFVAEFARSVSSGAKVLDAGAGPCRYRTLFPSCKYFAQDFAAYRGAEHRYGELDYVCDITAIPVEDGTFDHIICTEVLEHLPEPIDALREFGRILKPGGQLMLTAPLGSGLHMMPFHYYGGFTPSWYERFLPESGFTVERCEPNGGFFKFYGQESQRVLTMLTPKGSIPRALFLPIKALLAVWFRVTVPLMCHILDMLDRKKEFTVGYFVVARRT